MSVVSTKVQIGQNATALNNFVWERDAATGVLVLRRGTHDVVGSEILKVNADGGVKLNTPIVRAAATANQTLVSGAITKVALGNEIVDSHNNFSDSTFTCAVAGWYQIDCSVRAGGTNVTTISCQVYKNGAPALVNTLGGSLSAATAVPVSSQIYLALGDTLELWGYVTATSPTFDFANDSAASRFGTYLVRAA